MDGPNAKAPISPERWRRIEQLLDGAFDFPPGDPNAFLEAACSADPNLLCEVRSLLHSDADVPAFLDQDAAQAPSRPAFSKRSTASSAAS